MRVLLDTHVLLWTLGGTRRLSGEAVDAIREASDVLVSTVTFAELGAKAATGKFTLPDGFHQAVLESGARVLGLAPARGLAVTG